MSKTFLQILWHVFVFASVTYFAVAAFGYYSTRHQVERAATPLSK